MNKIITNTWPELPYSEFKNSAHLIHMCAQMLGKLKLHTPFEPHWANVPLWLTSRGLTTGLIFCNNISFNIDMDFIDHLIVITTKEGIIEKFALQSMSVANLYQQLFTILKNLSIDLSINTMPQEILSPIAFEKDTKVSHYEPDLANAWWRILLSSYHVMQYHHAKFNGESPAIGLMWGTLDLRDARYNGVRVKPIGINQGYIRRNAMDEAQVEIGWWHGNEMYPKAAYYAFIYPKPDKLELAKIQPEAAYWNAQLEEFILDYDHVRITEDSESALLDFFQSTYEAGASAAKWREDLIMSGTPV